MQPPRQKTQLVPSRRFDRTATRDRHRAIANTALASRGSKLYLLVYDTVRTMIVNLPKSAFNRNDTAIRRFIDGHMALYVLHIIND